ncbi:hypothetical protein TNCV_4475061 [Trichonephila clavipes]|nr:hypothetical protein TNCV_4475061 [Trichonephila clavipes]
MFKITGQYRLISHGKYCYVNRRYKPRNFECKRTYIVSRKCRMSPCAMAFHSSTCAIVATISAGCRRCWSVPPTISLTCSIGDRSGDLTGQDNFNTVEHVALQQQCADESYSIRNFPP